LRVNGAAQQALATRLQFPSPEFEAGGIHMDLAMDSPTSYRVEVSGWDEREVFFVEKTTLDWSEGVGKKIELRARVAVQAVVFVRLSHQLGGSGSFPIPYRAVEISAKRDGYSTVLVQQMQPRLAFQELGPLMLTPQELA
jgi:hypothetical protein